MSTGSSLAVALTGLAGERVLIETKVVSGLPKVLLVGLPDASINEAPNRVQGALHSIGTPMPMERVTINMFPAGLRKRGTGFDLAMAVSILAAAGVVDSQQPSRTVHIGELGLDGEVREIPGILPMVAAAVGFGADRVMVPRTAQAEAELVEGATIIPVGSLREVALHYGADADTLPLPEPDVVVREPSARRPDDTEASGAAAQGRDLADVVGNDEGVRALLVAAAGRHHLLMIGAPGAGKTMLAERLVDLLPDLGSERAIQAAAVRSLRGRPVARSLEVRPPFEAPHHTASKVALLGGGSGVILPGAVSLASGGVLFLDEAPEFHRDVLDALRQSLESGEVTIHRSGATATFPAKYQLVLAANPCPCGNALSRGARCTCPAVARRRYLARLSGPLLDRLDLQLHVARVSAAQQRVEREARAAGTRTATTTAAGRVLVEQARDAAAEQLRATPYRVWGEVPGPLLRGSAFGLPPGDTADLVRLVERGALTNRGFDKVLRVAWTIAGLDGADRPGRAHVREALFFRTSFQEAAA